MAAKSSFDTVGGRKFILAIYTVTLALWAASNKWIESTTFGDVVIYVCGFFMVGNAFETVKPGIGGMASTLMGKLKGGDKQPTTDEDKDQ